MLTEETLKDFSPIKRQIYERQQEKINFSEKINQIGDIELSEDYLTLDDKEYMQQYGLKNTFKDFIAYKIIKKSLEEDDTEALKILFNIFYQNSNIDI